MFNQRYYQQGRLGELLVVADLIKQGYSAFEAGPGLQYDVVVDVSGRLLRVQVKTVLVPRKERKTAAGNRVYTNTPYLFRTRLRAAGRNKSQYTASSFDLFALVALDTSSIAYMPTVEGLASACITIQRPDYIENNWTKRGRKMTDLTFAKALEAMP